jgi:hypothetical protein
MRHNKRKIKLCWNIPNKDHCNFDKAYVNFLEILFIASRPNAPLDDKPILAIDDQIDLPIAIKIILQMCDYVFRMIDKRTPAYVVDGIKRV